MKLISLSFFIVIFNFDIYAQVYKNQKLSSEIRAKNLLSLMNLDEKIAQMNQPFGWNAWTKTGSEINITDAYKKIINKNGIGSLYGIARADSWTEKTASTGLSPLEAAKASNAIQKWNLENTRLAIPIQFGGDGGHGHMMLGTTVFPVSVALASTWNPDLVQKAYAQIAKEARAVGMTSIYSPVLDIVRDPRWGRVEECYGEDYFLTSEFGKAAVLGYQGMNLGANSVLATIKHFVHAYPEGGHNAANVSIGERELQEVFFPFEKCIKAGAGSVMAAYNDIDGIPCHANKNLITNTLRKKWNFKGFVISDAGAISEIKNKHNLTENFSQTAALTVNAGVDMEMGADVFVDSLKAAVVKKLITIPTIDSAVYRILKAKFDLGLFENPYVDIKNVSTNIKTVESEKLALEVAQESIVLLKNKDNILPLKNTISSIAIIGPNADHVMNQLGDYTSPQNNKQIVTILDGFKNRLSPKIKINYAKGCAIKSKSKQGFAEALQAAQNSDIVIAVMGTSSDRPFKAENINKQTGAAIVTSQDDIDMDCGEGYDRADLNFSGVQEDLLKQIKSTGKKIIVVLINGRPISSEWLSENADAIVEAWYPGEQGGNAVADIVLGNINPSGKLTLSVPKFAGQIPVFYNHKTQKRRDYVETSAEPLFPFGYGLSYSNFSFSEPTIEKSTISLSESTLLQIEVSNTSTIDGTEVIQLYVNDEVSSITRPYKQLIGFQKIKIKAGEKKQISFKISPEMLGYWYENLDYKTEKGKYNLLVGNSSQNLKSVSLMIK